MSGLTLDTGALIGFERNDRRVVALLARARELGFTLTVPAGVVGQVWRDGRRQSRLARLLRGEGVSVEPLDDQRAREAGQLCGITSTRDVIDASVVLCARRYGQRVVTSDPKDIRRLDRGVLVTVV
jgi:predicted nucleic acid-binding protein